MTALLLQNDCSRFMQNGVEKTLEAMRPFMMVRSRVAQVRLRVGAGQEGAQTVSCLRHAELLTAPKMYPRGLMLETWGYRQAERPAEGEY